MLTPSRHPPIHFILLLVVLALLLGACSDGAAEPAPGELVHIIVGVRENLSYAPFFIAHAEGYFTEQGLDVELIPTPRTAEALAAMRGGGLDVQAGTLSSGIFNAVASGEPIKIVANRGVFDPEGCSYMSLVVRKDLIDSNEVNNVADLAGRSVSGAFDSVFGYFLDAALNEVGMSLDDVVEMDLPTATEIDAMTDGDLDASLQSEPDTTFFEQEGIGFRLVRSQEVLPGFSWGTLVFGPSLLVDNPAAGKAFMVAYLKGVRQFQEGKTERNLDILVEATAEERDLLEAACWPSFTPDGSIDTQAAVEFQEWSIARGTQDQLATVEQFWDSSFIDYANQFLETED